LTARSGGGKHLQGEADGARIWEGGAIGEGEGEREIAIVMCLCFMEKTNLVLLVGLVEGDTWLR
jgi:hypothetical protein